MDCHDVMPTGHNISVHHLAGTGPQYSTYDTTSRTAALL